MKYKVYYTNEYGKMVYPSGELFQVTDFQREYFEVYEDKDIAKAKGKEFLHEFPLMSCVIRADDGEEIVLSAEEDEFNEALAKKMEIQELGWKRRKWRDYWFRVFLIGFCIAILVLFYKGYLGSE